MIIIQNAPSGGIEPWLGAVVAVLVFVAGLALGPLTKSYEALFLEQRHVRRLLRRAARQSMHDLAQVEFQKFQLQHRSAVHKAMDSFQKALLGHGPRASAKDEATAELLQEAMNATWEAADADEYAQRKAAAYPAYLDLARRRRWVRRRKALRARQPQVRRADFVSRST